MVYGNNTSTLESISFVSRVCDETSMNVSNNIDAVWNQIHRLCVNPLCNQYGEPDILSSTATSTAAQSSAELTSAYSSCDAMGDIVLDWLYPWRRLVGKADTKERIVDAVRHFGAESIANRLAYLDKLAEEDPKEEVIQTESLRRFAVFVLDGHLPPPKIGISPGGLVQAVWLIPDGILSMDFLPYDKVRFATVLYGGKWSTRGALPPYYMIKEIEPFRKALFAT